MLVQEMSFSEFYDTKAPKGEYHNFTVDEYCATVVNWIEVNIIQSQKRCPTI